MDYQKKAWCQNIKAMHEVEIEILKPNQHKILWSKKVLKCMEYIFLKC